MCNVSDLVCVHTECAKSDDNRPLRKQEENLCLCAFACGCEFPLRISILVCETSRLAQYIFTPHIIEFLSECVCLPEREKERLQFDQMTSNYVSLPPKFSHLFAMVCVLAFNFAKFAHRTENISPTSGVCECVCVAVAHDSRLRHKHPRRMT